MFFKKKKTERTPRLDFEKRWTIISEFGAAMEAMKYDFERKSKLPLPENEIRSALVEEILFPMKPELANPIEVGLLQLESAFVFDDIYGELLEFHVLASAGSDAMLTLSKEKMDKVSATRLLLNEMASETVRCIKKLKLLSDDEKEEYLKQMIAKGKLLHGV